MARKRYKPEEQWVPPELAGEFHSAFGSSVVEEFIAGHRLADVLRELVQNEYDGNVSRLVISFGEKALTVRGNGSPIDRRGWVRLSVLLGTGQVVGDRQEPQDIRPKKVLGQRISD